MRPIFQACCLSRDHSLARDLMNLAAEEGMLGASPEVIEDKLGEWVCALQRLLNDHPKSVDFLARLLNRNLDLQLGRVVDLGVGYNTYRSDHVWAPRPFAGPPRRVLGTMRTRALPRLQLRGGNNGGGGNGAGFAGVVEAGFAGVVEEVGSGEVLGEVKEVGSDDIDDVLFAFGSDNGAEGCEGKVDDDAEGCEGKVDDDAEGCEGKVDDDAEDIVGAEDVVGAVGSVLLAIA